MLRRAWFGTAVAAWIAVVAAIPVLLLSNAGAMASGPARTFSFHSIASVPIGTNEAQSVVVAGKLYLFGGFDALKATFTPTDRGWVYDPANNRWTALPTMPTRGITHAGIATDGSQAVFWAGGSPPDASGAYQVYGTTDAWRFDVGAGTYSRLPSLPVARMGGGLSYVDGRLYYFGGNDITRTHDSSDVWMLDVAGGATSWVSRAPMPDPRNHIGWGVVAGEIYAVGGQHLDQSFPAQGDLDRYDPLTNTWTVLAPLPTPRGHLMDSTFVMDGMLVAAGGWTSTAVSAAVEAYDPATNAWQEWSPLPEARTSTTVKSVTGDRIVFCCGSAGTSSYTGWIGLPDLSTVPSATPTAAHPTSTPTTRPGPGPTATPPVTTPPVALAPLPVPTVPPAPTTPPSVAPTTRPSPSPPTRPAAALSRVALRPGTVASAGAGKAQLSFRISRAAKVSLVLQRCNTRGCAVVARLTVGSPEGASHISVHALSGRMALPVGHYRVVLTPAGGRTTTVGLTVSH